MKHTGQVGVQSMKPVGELLLGYEIKKVPVRSEDKAKHERAFWVEKTRKALGKNLKGKEYTFGQVNGLTRKWPLDLLKERFLYCEKYADVFGRVWFGMRKQDKEKEKGGRA